MKHLITIASLVATLTVAAPAFAAEGISCHFHGYKPAAEATVTDCAMQYKAKLVQTGKLDASWQAVRQEKIETVEGNKGKEWKVSFQNPAEKDKAKATLFLFFSLPGNFIAANFNGK